MLELFRQCWTGKIQFHSPVAIRPHPAKSQSQWQSQYQFPGWRRRFLFICISCYAAEVHISVRTGQGGSSSSRRRAWRWLINSGAYVCSQCEAELFILWPPCASLHDSGAQCWQHLTVFFQLIKGCFYFNVRFSHFITLAGQCSPSCLTGFSYRKKYIKKNILNITATCLRCDDINPVDKTIKKSCQKINKKMREYAKCRLLMRMLTIKMAKCIVNLFSFEIGICLTAGCVSADRSLHC